MYVPPFIPQQIEIPGNVAQESYSVRLGFVRRTVGFHFLTIVAILAISYLPLNLGIRDSIILTLASLVALSLVRGLVKGKHYEQVLSALFAPMLFYGLGQLIAGGSTRGWPQWTVIIGPAAAWIYSMLCGRDLSFVGMWVMSSLAKTLVSCGLALAGVFSWQIALEILLIGYAYLAFFVYDLACLLTRRRLGEEGGAVLDLYRDLLNCITYPIRIIQHWRKHRIWSLK
ncbi:MAG: hypothetical protein ABL962_14375 [Fimbriimonadaceae bacterium]